MGMDKGGPSAMSLYHSAGSQGTPADTGMAMGRQLYDSELAARTRYADPSVGPEGGASVSGGEPGPGQFQPPEYYNYQNPLPAKYQVPSAMKERMVAREAVRKAAGASSGDTLRTDPISEEEVSYLQAMQDQAELADFDRYVNSLIDPRKPGNLKWLMEIYPDFVNRRIQQVHTDYEYALRGQMIDSWGINTFDDLHFKYLQDQGKIKGPYLQTDIEPGAGYSSGLLAPGAFKSIRNFGVRLPFASARYGKSAPNGRSWVMDDAGQPLAGGRGLDYMAQSMYAADPKASGDRQTTFGEAEQPRRWSARP